MSDYSWVETCPDAKLKELQKMAASQVAFRNIPLWRRCIVGVALAIPFILSLVVTIGVLLRASQVEQFMALVGCGIGVALWALSREAKRRRELLYAIQVELARRE
jgi:membrane associated rhomboid family serine protease